MMHDLDTDPRRARLEMATRYRIFKEGQPVGHVDDRGGPVGTPIRPAHGVAPQHPTMTFAAYTPRFDIVAARFFHNATGAAEFVNDLQGLGYEIRPETIPDR